MKATANAAATTPEHEQTGFRPVGSSSPPDGSAIPIIPVSGPQYSYTHHSRPDMHWQPSNILSAARLMSNWLLAGTFLKRPIPMFRVPTRHLRGLQSLLLDPSTLSSLYGAMGTTSGAFLALSQLPGINMEAVQVMPSSCLKHMASAAFWIVA